ncbi:hypothetical protein P7C70_g9535, partial [Phenoliferia sp. Uapishka_3]
AGTNVQKERQKGAESLLVNPVVLTLAGLIQPNVISNALRVAQEKVPWDGTSRVQSRLVRWQGTASHIRAAATTQFAEVFGLFSSQLLETRGVSPDTPLVKGSWMCCRNPGSSSHAPFWFIAQNLASYTKTDRAGRYTHAPSIDLAQTLAAMHVRVYRQIPSSGTDIDLDDDVFRHLLKRRPLPAGTPSAGQLPPGRDALLSFVPGSDFVFMFPGECFIPGGRGSRELTDASARIWKTFNGVQVGHAFVHAIEADDQKRIEQKKEKARINREAKAEAQREMDKDGKAAERTQEKKRIAAVKKAAKAAAPRDEAVEAKKLEKKWKAASVKAAKDADTPASVKAPKAKKAPAANSTWNWLSKDKV